MNLVSEYWCSPAWPKWKRMVLGDRLRFAMLAPSLNHCETKSVSHTQNCIISKWETEPEELRQTEIPISFSVI